MSFSRIVRNYETMGKLGREIMQHKSAVVNIPRGPKIGSAFEQQHDKIELFLNIQKQTEEISKDVNYLVNEYWTGWD